jgi:hypothetical protein
LSWNHFFDFQAKIIWNLFSSFNQKFICNFFFEFQTEKFIKLWYRKRSNGNSLQQLATFCERANSNKILLCSIIKYTIVYFRVSNGHTTHLISLNLIGAHVPTKNRAIFCNVKFITVWLSRIHGYKSLIQRATFNF